MTRWLGLTIAAAAAVLAGGCRSDGGFDRLDSEHGRRYLVDSLADRTSEDARATWEHVTGAPGAAADSCRESLQAWADTYHLYLEASVGD